ncbi:hypothetical protein [Shimia marina]|uniref:Uncharacterized protein n=1 Tax=Shimia marina TaxID=321267 RepID=A0A0P1ERI1_9RHOB|nr:hypothetical protein [Shimia marina]CUH52621.1 hypothetical protein SHM7688_02068 [Shimia marina]SFE51903.1 hypothetical protein SAMN04488037_110120 [Shimia marina]
MKLEEMIDLAEMLDKKASLLGEDVIYADADMGIDVMAGMPGPGLTGLSSSLSAAMPESILAPRIGDALNFIDKQRGRSFLEGIAQELRAEFCDPDGFLAKAVEEGIEWTITLVVMAIAASLKLPFSPSVIPPLVVHIYRQGYDRFCRI